eukprot:3715938-Rhodomonas_salina.1
MMTIARRMLEESQRVHPKIKYKKPQFQYKLDRECGFLSLSWQCIRLRPATPCPIAHAGILLRVRNTTSGTDV